MGGTLTYPLGSGAPIDNGTSLTIMRQLPLLQTSDISTQGNLWPQVIETDLDTLCMQVQQTAARTGQWRGVWVSGAQYNYSDTVQDGVNGSNTGNYYMCAVPGVSTLWTTDLAAGDWILFFNTQAIINSAVAIAQNSAQIAIVTLTQAQLNAGQTLIAGVNGKAITVMGIQVTYSGAFATGTALVIKSTNASPVTVFTETLAGMGAGLQIAPDSNDSNQTLGEGFGIPLGSGDGLQAVHTGSNFTGGTSLTFSILFKQA